MADVASFFSSLSPSIALVGSVEVCATASRFCPNRRWWRLMVEVGGLFVLERQCLLITSISIIDDQENAAKVFGITDTFVDDVSKNTGKGLTYADKTITSIFDHFFWHLLSATNDHIWRSGLAAVGIWEFLEWCCQRLGGSGQVPEGIDGVNYPAQVIPIRSIGLEKDVINLDEGLSDKGEGGPIEENGEDAEAEVGAERGESERRAMDEKTPTASTSWVEGETGPIGESSFQAPKQKKKIISVDPDEIPDRTGKDPCPY
ncbi:hypothetical protein RHMOL_Rhmol07G0181300 [Rhododendron molle]|uniref:Uncharacterized protein n=1 Tax=Rhododendron molle TaxID=49168 RepID=A0ACC0N335_RHOML|nr:hypothetical protein RHMOL_Rhmol07G0181300 [Rhododendron molle]